MRECQGRYRYFFGCFQKRANNISPGQYMIFHVPFTCMILFEDKKGRGDDNIVSRDLKRILRVLGLISLKNSEPNIKGMLEFNQMTIVDDLWR